MIWRRRRHSAGFTLIELLVVVFLIGLISGFAVLSINSRGDDREILEQLKRFQYQLVLAEEEAVIRNRPIGVRLDEGGYRFLIAGRSQWEELEDVRALQPEEFSLEWKLELQVGGREVSLNDENAEDAISENDGQSGQPPPQIIFFSSGEIDPFELQVMDQDNNQQYRIRYGEEGSVLLEPVDRS